ncbi:MAG: ornithine cyclodeaminase family protein [Archangium sp.]|nr:ornithine cyclodeaminase family protein [Archangium sp.]
MLTAFLSRTDVSRHLQALHLLRELREAFSKHRFEASTPPLRTSLSEAGRELGGAAANDAELRLTTFPGVPAWSVLTQSKGRATLQLHDKDSGKLLAVMDAAQLLSLRAGMVSALAADVLARSDAKNVAVLGMGAAASSALKSLRLVRSIERVWFHEPNVADNFELARRLSTTLSMAISAVDTPREAVLDADLVVLTGHVALGDATLRPGTHVTVLGADQFAAPPISRNVLESARRFRDATSPTLTWSAPFDLELREALDGSKPGRESADQLTVFASVSPPQLDLLTAWHVFEGARHDDTLTRIDLEA